MRGPVEEVKHWLEEAEYDLETAEDVLEDGRWNWACFIAQQSAEKAVKSIYIARGEDVERVHSISALLKGDDPVMTAAGYLAYLALARS